jgi:hypothetical protein
MINEYVEDIMRNSIMRFAEQHGKREDEAQLLISWDDEKENPKYKKIVFGESNQEVELHEVLGTKKNIFNKPKEAMIDNFITNALHKYSEELECEPNQVFVLIYLELINESEDILKLHLYKGSTPIKEISLQQILT